MYVQSKTLEFPFWKKISTKMLFFMLSTLLISIFVLYAYLVHQTIMNVVAREKTENTYQSLATSIGDLESQYLSLKSGVTIDVAYAHGFQDANPQFISLNQNIAYNSSFSQ